MKQILRLCFFFTAWSIAPAATAGHLDFVQNDRQWPEQVRYKANLPGGAVFFTGDRFVYNYQSPEDMGRLLESIRQKKDSRYERVRGHAYQVLFPGCNPSAMVSGNDKKAHYHNYFLGNDPSKWAAGVPVFEGITYDELYPGIDLSVYSNDAAMKYDFVVAAGADPSLIRLKFDGVRPRLTPEGTLEIRTSVNTVVEQAPYVYQVIDGAKKEVACRYRINRKGEVTFVFPDGYDRDVALVIDPTLVFITWTGSTAPNIVGASAYDQAGNLYALAAVCGAGWPVTTGAYQTVAPGPNMSIPPYYVYVDIGINKYNSTGSTLLYSTYLGGEEDIDMGIGMTVNNAGELILCGYTASSDFPTTPGCYSNTLQGLDDLFALRFNAAGTALLGATFIGGSGTEGGGASGGAGADVAVDNMGNILCAGVTLAPDFPTTPGVFQPAGNPSYNICIFKFNPTCSSLLFSTYLGGSMFDGVLFMKYKSTGEILVSGVTYSPDFPTTPATIHPNALGGADGFVSVLSADAGTLLYSTYVGTPAMDGAYETAEDAAGNIYVSGYSDGGYPISPGLYSNFLGRFFVHKLSPSLTDLASTRLGGDGLLYPHALSVDECGSVRFAFIHNGYAIPVTPNAHQAAPGGIYIGQLTPDMTALDYATHLGNPLVSSIPMGKAVFDKHGYLYASFYLTQFTGTFPTTPGCFAPVTLAPASDQDGISYKFKLDPSGASADAQINGNDTGCVPFTVQFGNNSANAVSYLWDFGDGTTSTSVTPSHTYTVPGTYQVQLIAYNPNTCITSDTSFVTVYALQPDTAYASADSVLCAPGPLVLHAPPGYQSHTWQDGSTAPTFSVINAGIYRVISSNLCSHRIDSFAVEMVDVRFSLGQDTTMCAPYVLHGPPIAAAAYLWSNGSTGQDLAVQASGAYWVRVSKQGCVHADTAVVTYRTNNTTVTDTLVCNDQPVDLVLQTTIPPGGAALWSNGSTDTQIRVQQAGIYWVTVTTGTCRNSDTTNVVPEYCECEIYVPTAFSPNGDGRNDVFRALAPPECPLSNFTMSVYNRWGQRVFSSIDPRKGWDGRFGGASADAGTYMFVVEAYAGGRGVHRYRTGDVTLVR